MRAPRMTSRRKPMNDRAGYVASRRNPITGGWNVIYRASEAGLDPSGGPWVVSCEEHGVVCNHKNLPGARSSMKWPGFCEACMALAAKEKAVKGPVRRVVAICTCGGMTFRLCFERDEHGDSSWSTEADKGDGDPLRATRLTANRAIGDFLADIKATMFDSLAWREDATR